MAVGPTPMPSMSAGSSAKSGDISAGSTFMSGDFNFGSGGGSFNVGGLVSQYWPILAVAGAVWYFKFRKK